MKQAVIIGGGIAGIASSLRLNKLGYKVTLLEASDTLGGKLRQFEAEGFRFDQGPSLFTLPHLVEELFALYGKNVNEYFQYEESEIATQYFFSDKSIFTAYSEPKKFSEEVLKKWGVNVSQVLQNIIDDYNKTSPIFIENSLTKVSDLLTKEVWVALPVLTRIGVFESLHQFNKKHFKHPQLVQLFDRYATYNGSNPYQTPSIMRVISALEHQDGVFFPKRGMRSIVTSLVQLAEEEGVTFLTNKKVESISVSNQKNIRSVKTSDGVFDADLVVSNVDVNFFIPNILDKKIRVPREKELSSSAMVFYWGVNKSFDQLHLHNIFFSEDYKKEFQEIFDDFKIPTDPTIYVHISSKINEDDAPKGSENWFVMINVPPKPELFTKEVIAKVEKRVMAILSKQLETNLEEVISYSSYWSPKLIEQDTQSWKGALYGLNSNKLNSAFYRQRNKSKDINNLYFVGGSVHPGGGIPLCLNSAKIVEELITNQ
ncbi:NAD(P)/FAD-dependent oxidoreductase [Flammeovirga sp. OC4]|uniref:phytoene desaturase family protein n=1 Tax=Flammeovirga sp. OC4 TaxID=1382345 RepID=UPI0005C4CBB3|nr:phytoene desaturase family protein [Flammeovirga sp. OC4]